MGQNSRQKIANILRELRLLPLADFIWFLWLFWRNRPANQRFLREHPDALIPPSLILYDILGGCDIGGYYDSGREHAQEITRLITMHRDGPLRILEWGCGPARVLQHLSSSKGQEWQLCGSDYNPRTVDWCKRCLPGIEFLRNDLSPPIPVESASFDVVYCISVFTHLSEPMHFQWVNEIFRVLKPGGLFIGTFHGSNYRDELTPKEQKLFDVGTLVVRDKIREGKKNFSAYHGDEFVHRLLASFTTHWQEPTSVFRQTVWCAVKAKTQDVLDA